MKLWFHRMWIIIVDKWMKFTYNALMTDLCLLFMLIIYPLDKSRI